MTVRKMDDEQRKRHRRQKERMRRMERMKIARLNYKEKQEEKQHALDEEQSIMRQIKELEEKLEEVRQKK